MDPNEALKRLREILYAEDEDVENISDDEIMGLIAEVSITFLGLDEWLQKGGFLPADWRGQPELIRQLRNLLAVIHRDGGHYTAKVGLSASIAEAMRLSSERLPNEPEPPTAWTADCGLSQYRVICTGLLDDDQNCGPQHLTERQYQHQMRQPNKRWRCPGCGAEAWWDDDWYEGWANACLRGER